MIKPLLILLFLLTVATGTKAQDSSLYNYSHDSTIKTTVIPNGRHPTILYTANGKQLSKQDLIDRFLLYEPSATEYQKYKEAKTGVLIWGVTALSLLIGGGITYNNHQPTVSHVLLWTAGGGLVLELASGVRSGRHWDLSIEAYNRRFLWH